MSDAFISYSRVDTDFVRRLHDALSRYDLEVWVDWEDIPLTADWRGEIRRGIENANNFIFIVSPDSAISEVCHQEVQLAVDDNKRIVPIVYRDVIGAAVASLHPSINAHNWVFCRTGQEDFAAVVESVVEAMATDLGYVREHTRLLVRAREWEEADYDKSYLLSGSEMEEAELWLAASQTKKPDATELQAQYIITSRQAAARRQRTILSGVLIALVVALVLLVVAVLLGIEANNQRHLADQQRVIAVTAESNAAAQRDLAHTAESNAETQRDIAEENAATATVAQGEAIFQAGTATVAQGEAEFQRSTAVAAESTAVSERDRADVNAELAAQQAATAEARRIEAEHSAATATVAQGEAIIQAVTATVAQGEAIFQAGTATVAQGEAIIQAITATVAQGEAIFQAGTATVAQGEAIFQAVTATVAQGEAIFQAGTATVAQGEAIFQGATAIAAESTAISARATAEYNEIQALSQSLAVNSELALAAENPELALALAIESVRLNPGQVQSQRVLTQAVNAAPHYVLNAHNGSARALDVFDTLAVSGGDGGTLLLWDVTSGEALRRFEHESVAQVLAVDFSPDGQLIAAVGLDVDGNGSVVIWDANSGEVVRILGDDAGRHDDAVYTVTFSANGRQLFTASEDNSMIAWSIADGTLVSRQFVPGQRRAVFNPDGQTVALLGVLETDSLAFYDRGTQAIYAEFETAATVAVYPPDAATNRVILSGDGQGGTNLWNEELFEVWGRGTLHGAVEHLFWGTGGAVVHWQDGTISLIDPEDGRIIRNFVGHHSPVTSVAISPDGEYVMAGARDGTIRQWDVNARAGLEVNRFPDSGSRHVTFSPDGGHVLGTNAPLDVITGEPQAIFVHDMYFENSSGVINSTYSADGRFLFRQTALGIFIFEVESGDFLLQVGSGQDGAPIGNVEGLDAAVVYTLDGDRAFSTMGGEAAGRLGVWDLTRGVEVGRIGEPGDYSFSSLALSPDGRYLLGGSGVFSGSADDFSLVLFDVETGREVRRYGASGQDGHVGQIMALAFSPDGGYALSAGADGDVILWNVGAGQIERHLVGHSSAVNSAAFSADGQMALSGDDDGLMLLWDVGTGISIRRYQHADPVLGVGLNPAGRLAASVSAGGLILWRIDTTGELVAWALRNRVVPDFTCAERETYNLEPCGDEEVALTPTLTPLPSITPSPTMSPTPDVWAEGEQPGVISSTGDRVNMRSGPGEGYPIVIAVDNGTPVTLLGEEDGWINIRLADGTEGWVISLVAQRQ